MHVLARKLANSFCHPTQVSMQVQFASTCDYLQVCLSRALLLSKCYTWLKKTKVFDFLLCVRFRVYIENIKQTPQRKVRNLLLFFFCLPGHPVVRCLVPRETRPLFFLNSSFIKWKDWTNAYFEQFNSLGIKHIRPARWKST